MDTGSGGPITKPHLRLAVSPTTAASLQDGSVQGVHSWRHHAGGIGLSFLGVLVRGDLSQPWEGGTTTIMKAEMIRGGEAERRRGQVPGVLPASGARRPLAALCSPAVLPLLRPEPVQTGDTRDGPGEEPGKNKYRARLEPSALARSAKSQDGQRWGPGFSGYLLSPPPAPWAPRVKAQGPRQGDMAHAEEECPQGMQG